MLNIWLIVLMCVFPFALLVANIYLLVYFQHTEDKYAAWVAKFFVLFGLELSEICILMLPLDVANRGPPYGEIPMGILWLVVYITMAALSIIVFPFIMFYYEAEEPEHNSIWAQIRAGFFAVLFVLFVFCAIGAVTYVFFGVAEVPTDRLSCYLMPNATEPSSTCPGCAYKHMNMDIRVSPVLFIITLITFFGWALLMMFGGIGLAALPFDLINDFRFRPRRISEAAFQKGKLEIASRAQELHAIGERIKENKRIGKRSRKDRDHFNRFRQAVYILDYDYKRLKESYSIQGIKLFIAHIKVVLGVLAVCVSIMWYLHIIIYMAPVKGGINPFLNTVAIKLNEAWGLLGTIFYGIFSFYLLLCCIKGVLKFGMRCFVLFPIYPMEVDGTTMSSFLFNVGIILIESMTVTQFCTTAFADFTATTSINQIFEMSIDNLRIIKYFWTYSIYAMLAMVLLTLAYLFVRPRETPATAQMDPRFENFE